MAPFGRSEVRVDGSSPDSIPEHQPVASHRSTWSTDPMEYTEIAYAVDARIATVTLDRPAVLNAFTTTMQHELLDVFDRIDADDDVRVVIVTGRGRGFCAGADLSTGGSAFDA